MHVYFGYRRKKRDHLPNGISMDNHKTEKSRGSNTSMSFRSMKISLKIIA